MSTKNDALATVYAKSLFELAEQAGGMDKIVEVASELDQIAELARGDRVFREFLSSPIVDRASRSKSLGNIFSNRVTDLTLRFLLVLNDKGRLGHFEAFVAAFDGMVQEAFGRIEIDLFTPAPMGEEQLEAIRSRIHASLGKEPVLHPYTDAAMLGGIKLRIGDQLIDGSVANRLRRIKNGLMTHGSTAIRNRIENIIEEGGS
jgi:F-type H+-transporting ATPase subunit delta